MIFLLTWARLGKEEKQEGDKKSNQVCEQPRLGNFVTKFSGSKVPKGKGRRGTKKKVKKKAWGQDENITSVRGHREGDREGTKKKGKEGQKGGKRSGGQKEQGK